MARRTALGVPGRAVAHRGRAAPWRLVIAAALTVSTVPALSCGRGTTPPAADAATAAAERTAAGTHGGEPHQAGGVRRIVSLVPAVTEMLFAIGAGPRVVAVSSFDRYPPEVRSLPKVGALIDPDLERIIALRPDLVVIDRGQVDLAGQLGRAGIGVFAYSLGGLDNVAGTMERLGAVTGRAEEAGRAVDAIRAALDAVRRRVAGRRRPATLLVFGREPGTLRNVYASGGVGFLHDLVELAGGRNVFGEVDRESLQVTTESILAAAPEVIIELRYGASVVPGSLDAERASWRALGSVPAVRNGHIHVLVGDELVVPGPRVAATAARFADALHPDPGR